MNISCNTEHPEGVNTRKKRTSPALRNLVKELEWNDGLTLIWQIKTDLNRVVEVIFKHVYAYHSYKQK